MRTSDKRRYYIQEKRLSGGGWYTIHLFLDGTWEDAVSECSKLRRRGPRTQYCKLRVEPVKEEVE